MQKLLIYIIKNTPMQKNEKNGGLAMDKEIPMLKGNLPKEINKTLVIRIDGGLGRVIAMS